MLLIGINGFKRSGKGTVAEMIADIASPQHVLGVGFADKLKILAAKTLGHTDMSDQECIDLMDEFKETGLIVSQRNVGGREIKLDETFMGDPASLKVITGRQYLQNLGNEGRKVFGDTFWIDMVLPNPQAKDGWASGAGPALLELAYGGVDILCITDLRYENEARRVKDLGGVIWEVVRPGLQSDGHASEQPLPRDLVDHTFVNDGSLDDLRWKVDKKLELAMLSA